MGHTLDEGAVGAVKTLALQTAAPVEIGDHTYSASPLVEVQPAKIPAPTAYVVHTLRGFVEYLKRNPDGLPLADATVHVAGPDRVSLYGRLHGHHNQRFEYARAEVERGGAVAGFAFNTHIGKLAMVIGLQALFDDAQGDIAAVKQVVGNLRDEDVRTVKDDGVSQKVTAESATGPAVVLITNPVHLAPHRTFPEVSQPASPFVLRVDKGPRGDQTVGLWEADGGAWRLEAILRIERWLRGELGEMDATIIA